MTSMVMKRLFDDIPQVWSFGGGVQTAAIAALIIQGKLPKPDYTIFVNTERERSSTWRTFHEILQPALHGIGIDVHVVNKSEFATVDLWGGEDGDTVLMPMYTNISGKTGKLPNYCSSEWKRDVAKRYIRKVLKLALCQMWIGFSTNEMRRILTPRELWCQLRYPLIYEEPMSRIECQTLIWAHFGVNVFGSSCWNCPNHTDADWIEIQEHDPSDFAQAVVLEREVRRKDPTVFLHPSCVPLDKVQFNKDQPGEGNGCAGGCFT